MHSYLFILGNNQALSVAEILNKFQSREYSLINKEVFRVDFENKIDAQKVIGKIGGTIKIVELLSVDFGDVFSEIEKYLPEEFNGKYKFGFSFYNYKNFETKKLAMDIKRELKARGVSSRWIISKGRTLSSVVVQKNKMVEQKSEFVVVESDKKYFGITRAVQDFKNLSIRDYNRPARDSYSGMIPPKLAQIMLNIGLQGKNDQIVLDPFCGSGTILMEAYLMGVKKILGTDLSKRAVKDSEINLCWVKNNFQSGQRSEIEIKEVDVRELSNFLVKDSVDVIVTEPYLGPQRKIDEIEKSKKSLEELYSKAISEFGKILKKDGRIVMIWPVLRKAKDSFLKPNYEGFKTVNQLPDELELEKTKRETIIYGRKGQRVWREIVVLEKVV